MLYCRENQSPEFLLKIRLIFLIAREDEERLMAGGEEDEMVGWHYQLNGHGFKFGWTPGVGDGQGGLACCGSWGRKESDTTERLN